MLYVDNGGDYAGSDQHKQTSVFEWLSPFKKIKSMIEI